MGLAVAGSSGSGHGRRCSESGPTMQNIGNGCPTRRSSLGTVSTPYPTSSNTPIVLAQRAGQPLWLMVPVPPDLALYLDGELTIGLHGEQRCWDRVVLRLVPRQTGLDPVDVVAGEVQAGSVRPGTTRHSS